MDFRPFKIGKYLLLERLATGGMAEVYRAKASGAGGFEKQLAIKRILPTYSANEEFRRMFEYEARLSSMLTHANIVQVYDFVKSGETYLLAMEYVDGKNLRQFLNKAKKIGVKVPLPFCLYVLNETCKGLEYAHAKKDDLTGKPLNIIHRDMSPQNVMLSYDGAVKIVDFGIAKAKDRVDETRSGVIKGKFGYMSPEQANGQPIDHRSDIFSTAIILWEMLTGRRLFSAENDMATLKLIQECVIPSPTRLNPKIPPDMERVVMKGLTKDLNLRFQAAGDLHRHLQAFISKHFPSFTQRDAADIISQCFRDDIKKEQKRFEQVYRQSIPFSQGVQQPKQADDLEELLDGEVTKSEHGENTPVTFADEQVSLSGQQEYSEPDTNIPSDPDYQANSIDIDDTQVDSLILDDDVPSTQGGRTPTPTEPATRLRKPVDPEADNTVVEDPALDITQPRAPRSAPRTNTGRTGGRTGPGTGTGKTPTGLTPPTGAGSRKGQTGTGKPQDSYNSRDIILRNEDMESNSGSRRRERSISALTEMTNLSDAGGSGQDQISLVSMKPGTGERMNPGTTQPTFNTDYRPRRKKGRLGSFLTAVLIVFGGVYVYQTYLEGGLPTVVQLLRERLPTGGLNYDPNAAQDPGKDSDDGGLKIAETGDCTVKVVSDPAGARVFVDGDMRGVTNTTVSGNCDSSIAINIKKFGFEPVFEEVKLKEPLQEVYKTLVPLPMGQLRLTVSRNATVEVEGEIVAEATANQTFTIQVAANREVTVRFVNQVLGLQATRQFNVQQDAIVEARINLDSE